MTTIPMAGRTLADRSVEGGAERLVNLYQEVVGDADDLRARSYVHGVPGLKEYAFLPTGDAVRALHFHSTTKEERLYVVAGEMLYGLGKDGAVWVVGSVGAATGTAQMLTLNDDLIIRQGGAVYVLRDRNLMRVLAGTATGGVGRLAWIEERDGYLVGVQEDETAFRVSRLDNPFEWEGLDNARAVFHGDRLIAAVSHERFLVMFGTETIELWLAEDRGALGTTFPFERSNLDVKRRGCVSRETIARSQNMLFFVGDDLRVYRMLGAQIDPVSVLAVEEDLRAHGDSGGWRASSARFNNHVWYFLTFGEKTWVWDDRYEAWHERQTEGKAWIGENGEWAHFRNVFSVGRVQGEGLLSVERQVFDQEAEVGVDGAEAGFGTDLGTLPEAGLTLEGATGGSGREIDRLWYDSGVGTLSIRLPTTGGGEALADGEGRNLRLLIGDRFFDGRVSSQSGNVVSWQTGGSPMPVNDPETDENEGLVRVKAWWVNGETVTGGTCLAEMSADAYDDMGRVAEKVMQTPLISIRNERYSMTRLRADLRSGVGIPDPFHHEAAEPFCVLQISDDGGKEWSNEIPASMGGIGDREFQAEWWALGLFQNRTLRFRISAPVPVSFLRLDATLSPRVGGLRAIRPAESRGVRGEA